jgi:arsenate reductase
VPSEGRIHLHLYGIPDCDSCRKARRWLQLRNVPHSFHDVREDGLSIERARDWFASAHGPWLLNRRSTTWRRLSDAEKEAAQRDPASLVVQYPTLLKRPVITDGSVILDVGFEPDSLEDYI